jgi:hypothetical protein
VIPRPDLSNDDVLIETGDGELRVMGRPKLSWVIVLVGLLVGLFSVFLLIVSAERPLQRLLRGRRDPEDLLPLFLAALPLLAWVGLAVMILIRWRRPRGIEIRDAVVTLHTPDASPAMHVFDQSDLAGTRVSGGGQHGACLLIQRRRAREVQLLPGHQPESLYTAVDAINSMVIDNVYHAFEVIPIAKPATDTTRGQS